MCLKLVYRSHIHRELWRKCCCLHRIASLFTVRRLQHRRHVRSHSPIGTTSVDPRLQLSIRAETWSASRCGFSPLRIAWNNGRTRFPNELLCVRLYSLTCSLCYARQLHGHPLSAYNIASYAYANYSIVTCIRLGTASCVYRPGDCANSTGTVCDALENPHSHLHKFPVRFEARIQRQQPDLSITPKRKTCPSFCLYP